MSEIEWELMGKIERSGHQTHYRYAYSTDAEGNEEKYRIGDCAYMGGGEGEWWVGIILDLYDDPSKEGEERLRVILRWFYDEAYLDSKTTKLIGVPKTCLENELYFADDVSYSDNDLSVIAGKAYVYQDKDEFKKRFKENDASYLVRCYYSPKPSSNPKLRLLEKGELRFLLNHPGTDEMFDRFAKAPENARRKYMADNKMEEYEEEEEKEDGKYAVELEDGDAAISLKQLRKIRKRSRDEVDEEKPLTQRRKKGEPSVVDIMLDKSQRFRKL